MSADSIRTLLKNLGLAEEDVDEMRSGSPSEVVDKEKIRLLFTGELHGASALEVSYLLSHEEEWFKAGNEVLIELGKETEAAAVRNRQSAEARQSARNRISSYLEKTADDLLSELMRLTSGQLVGTRSSEGIEGYAAELRQLICVEWEWHKRREEPDMQDPVACAEAIHQVLIDSSLSLPFPPDLVAAYLVKEGLDILCDC